MQFLQDLHLPKGTRSQRLGVLIKFLNFELLDGYS